MKTVMIAVMLVAASFVAAQTAVKIEGNLDGGKQIDLLTCHDGTFAYACVSEGWGEAYAGKTYSPAPWLELAAGAGLETGQDSLRFGGWAWAGQGHYSLLYVWERGGSGPWHKAIAMTKVTDALSLGVIDRSYYGRGVNAEYKLGSSSKLSAAWYGDGKGTVSISTSF